MIERCHTLVTPADWKPVITGPDEDGERQLELRLSPTKQLFVRVTPDGLQEPIVYHDDTKQFNRFRVLPASQWAAVTELVAERIEWFLWGVIAGTAGTGFVLLLIALVIL